ncbi:Hydroxymethylglutaryl-CoA synthase 1 [Portunus trituberculatus]|uniref:Hydroxymethylglutaryl-CoA synthase n=1 Tax=Portunus trituberculatus TaxID=210409 RepID=A0A5B7E3G6_PORTR|nr:Hydroxymethylglutaryl-CoA synthase 1 [Portunus trituberculatus]
MNVIQCTGSNLKTPGLRGSHMCHVYDFYKPDLSSEYPTVDGKLSIQCYLSALDACYRTFSRKVATKEPSSPAMSLHQMDAFIFHSPYCKLVQKSLARLCFNDFLNCPADQVAIQYPGLEAFREKKLEDTYFDRDVEKAFMAHSQDLFLSKTKPSLLIATQVGNMYTPSLFGGLASFISRNTVENLAGKRVALFSYGSGLAATMYSLRITQDIGPDSPLTHLVASLQDLQKRLDARYKISPPEFAETMKLRQDTHHKASKIIATHRGKVGSVFDSPAQKVVTLPEPSHSSRIVAGGHLICVQHYLPPVPKRMITTLNMRTHECNTSMAY